MIPNIFTLLNELHEWLGDANKVEYTLSREDVQILCHYVNYLQQIERHVRDSLQSDLSPYGFKLYG
jgi:hypothetical protein